MGDFNINFVKYVLLCYILSPLYFIPHFYANTLICSVQYLYINLYNPYLYLTTFSIFLYT